MVVYSSHDHSAPILHAEILQAFEWVVRDVHRLTALIESEQEVEDEQDASRAQDAQDFEILKQSPLLGDGKFKLEIGAN